jgi:hypothetical protein
MMGWGAGADTGRRVTLYILGGLVVAVLVLLSGLFDATQARVAEQGTYCLQVGRTYNVNGDLVEEGRWSDNGGRTWQ